MRLLFGRLLTGAWCCQHFLVRGVSGRGEDEEDKVRPSAEWLDEFYSNVDNVLSEGHLTPSVSDLPDLPLFTPRPTTNNTNDESKPTTTRPPETDNGRKLVQPQDLLQGQAIGSNILYNAEGVSFEFVSPPDTSGDVGTDHYVQMINSGQSSVVRILNKNNDSFNKTFILDGLGAGGDCAIGRGDPIVLFDQFASRWFLSEFSSAGNKLCVYISTSDDATGTYYKYEFPAPAFPDYPKYGVWNDAYYVGTNEGDPNGIPAMYALERSKMLTGAPAKIVRNSGPPNLEGFVFQLVTPVDADGDRPPPTGPGLFVRHVDDESHPNYVANPASDLFEIYTLTVNFATLTATHALLQTIQVNEFDSNTCSLVSFDCVPQPGSPVLLDPLREPVMNRPQYRNFGTHETLLATWMTDVGTNLHAFHWMELRKAAGASSWVVHQQNNFSPDTTHRWMSSPAMNGCGDIAIGYSVSSSSVNPGLRVTGRLSADPLNQLDAGEVTLVNGAGPSNSDRWGDYSAMVVDPDDDYTFWYTSEYIPVNNGRWSTRIVKFTLGSEYQAAATASPTKAPVAATASPTKAPVAATASPTRAPVAATVSPNSSPGSGPGPGPTPKPGKSTCGIVRKLLGIC